MSETVRLVLVDDHELMRSGVRTRLSVEPGIEVVGEAECGLAALDLAQRLKPNVVVVDLSMKGLSGFDLIAELQKRHSEIRCLVLSMHDGAGYMQKAKQLGAAGYVVKEGPSSELCDAIRTVASGGSFFPRLRDAAPCPLTPREMEVLADLCRGLCTKEIASLLSIAPKTVETHRANIREKLGLFTLAEQIFYARTHAID